MIKIIKREATTLFINECKRTIRIFSLILLLCFFSVVAGCGGSSKKDPVPVLKKIEIQPATTNVQLNGTCKFTAIGKDQNGKAMTIKPTWKVNGGIGSVSPSSGATTTFTAGAVGSGTVTATVGKITGSAQIIVSQEPPVLTTLVVTPDSVTVVNGETQVFTATGKDQYGADIALPDTPIWGVAGGIGEVAPASGNTTTFTATSLGNGTVTATVGGLEGVAQVTVAQDSPVLSRIEISPATSSFLEGEEKTFTATGYDQYDNQYAINPTWNVSGVSGTFSPETGTSTTCMATSDGTGTITATYEGVTGSASITVNDAPRLTQIIISPGSATLNERATANFEAEGRDQYGNVYSINPTWSVSGGIGTVSPNSGSMTTFTAANPGNGMVTATDGSVSGSANVTVNSTTIRVPQDYATIQAAVDGASNGITIIVSEGTYNECISIQSKSITLRSVNPDDPTVVAGTVINGNSNGSVVTISGSSTDTVTVEGFTVTGGSGSSGTMNYGGGVYVSVVPAVIRKNLIKNNSAYDGGGGIYGYMCDLTLIANTIEENSSYKEGGGIYLGAGVGYTLDVTLTDNIIRNNASTDRSAGGIYTWNVGGTWSGNTIERNTAVEYAGGIDLNVSSPVIINNQITNNKASGAGGIDVSADSTPTIQGNTISGNQATDLNGYGGGLRIYAPNLVLSGNIISGNSSERSGGGIYAIEDITLTNNEISNNTADWGGGIFIGDTKTLTAGENTFTDNSQYAIYLTGTATWVDNGGNTFSGNTPTDIN